MAESFTNQAREQAESKSSFFKREKLLSGFRSKRSRITGAKFKKGTSQESSDNIEKRVAQNEKKITLLKNIIKLRKENVDKQLKPEDTPQQMGSPLLNSLQSIAASVDSIRDTLIQKQDNDEDIIEDMRIAGEKADADKQEKGLENTNPKPLAKLGDKVIAPVMGIFEKIFNFIKTLILGKFLMNFLDWFSNPANQKKIASFVRFIKDWWPALTAAVLLFGTGFASLAAGLVKIVAGFTVKLIALIPKLMAALAKLKMGKLLKMIPGGKGKAGLLLKGATLIGGGVLLEKTISGDFSGKDEEEPQEFNKGGQVPGSGNKDTVPAMLTPGEFVMSKGAVQKYGTDTLAGMNAAAGGTNRPTLMGRYNLSLIHI